IPDVYFKKVRGIIICYDISNRSSFENVERWIEISKLNPKVECEIILVGTKSDSPSRQVSYEEGLELSTKHELKLFFETSSKTGENVNEMFYELLKLLARFNSLNTDSNVKIPKEEINGKSCNII
ncbi:rab family small GTPase, partial [Naegleria gruberi]